MPIDIGSVASVITSLNTAGQIAKGMIGLHNDRVIAGQVIELQNVIINAQNAAFAAQQERAALIKQVESLKEKMAKMKKWDAEKKRYELKEVYPDAFAYAIKPNAKGAEPNHWLCQTCCENGEKSLFQARPHDGKADYNLFYCPRCRAEIRTSWNLHISPNEAFPESL